MPFIYELIKTLSVGEKKQLLTLNLQEREMEVLQIILNTHKKIFPTSTVCKQLKLQTSHFDKLKSTLLKKSLENLAAENIYKQVHFLNSKNGLWNLSKHILRIYEEKELQLTSKEDQFIFYKFCFEWIVGLPFSHQTDNEIQKYFKKVQSTCANDKIEKVNLWMRIVLLKRELKLRTSQATLKLMEQQSQLKNKLQQILLESKKTKDAEIIFQSKSLAMLFYTFSENFTESETIYKELLKLFQIHKNKFNAGEINLVHAYHAQALYHNNFFKESYLLFLKTYPYFKETEAGKWFMYYTEYMHVSLLTGHFDTAKQLCLTYFSKFNDDTNSSMYISSTLQMIKYFLHVGELAKAHKFILKVEKHVSKITLLQFQFALRELKTAYYYLSGDVKNALAISEKNLKYMRSKNIHISIPSYTYHSRLVKAICRYKMNMKPLTKNELFMLDEMQKGTMAQYGFLVNKFYSSVPDGIQKEKSIIKIKGISNI